MWLNFSEWMIAVGLLVGALAAIVLLIEFFGSRVIRTGAFGWAHLLLFYAALIVELFNAFVHTIDGWTAVVPKGMILSGVGDSRSRRSGRSLLRTGHAVQAPAGATMKLRTAAAVAACLALAAWADSQSIDKSAEYGPDPKLPEPSRALLPRMHIPKAIGWSQGETPTVPQGFRIEAVATGLSNPRNVYPLSNGDLLVIESKKEAKEPIERPKRPIMAWVESKAHGGSGGGPSNRILLLRDTNGDGEPDAHNVLVDHLNSPFGVVLVGDNLYVADTDAILRFPFKVGHTKAGAPVKVVDLAGGADQSPLDEEPDGEPRRIEALCRCWIEQQRNGTRSRGRDEPRRNLGSRFGQWRVQGVCARTAQSERPDVLSGQRHALDGRQRARPNLPTT